MMFEKDNTNFNGECLCESCQLGFKVKADKHYCLNDKAEHTKVGVCKYYVQFYEER